jgi:outer membrane protein assembly factor BamE (lipoprotein component of BamABCDE complex)
VHSGYNIPPNGHGFQVGKGFIAVNCRFLCVAGLAAALSLAACQATVDQRGNLPDTSDLTQIKPGKTDKTTVTRLLGTPSSVAAFDSDTWYYISQKTKNVAFFKPEMLDQEVVAIHFDKDGIVKSIDHKTLQDAEAITPDPNATPTRGRTFSVIEQFLGNFGRFVNKNSSKENP